LNKLCRGYPGNR